MKKEKETKRKISVGFGNPFYLSFEELKEDAIYVGLWKMNDTKPDLIEINAKSKREFNYIDYSPKGKEIPLKGRVIKKLLLDHSKGDYKTYIKKLKELNNGYIVYTFEEDGLELTRDITHLRNRESHLELNIAKRIVGRSLHDINP